MRHQSAIRDIRSVRCVVFGALSALAALPVLGQTPRALTAADYERAERFMPYNMEPLMLDADTPTWLTKGTLWYRRTSAEGSEFVRVDVARGTQQPAFDQNRLAQALSRVTGKRYDRGHLPFRSFELSGDGARVSFDLDSKHWSCDVRQDRCVSRATVNPNEALSPDGKRAAFIRDYNLWVRDVASGVETQLTHDGVKDFGYATDNAGWKHTDRAIVSWSADSRRIATYQQDQRGVGEMYLIRTQEGHPDLDAWKYALPGDAVVPLIQRVIIDVDSGRVVRLQMPPDERRTAHCYDLDCGPGGSLTDVQWRLDGLQLAFISVSRDHKIVWLRVADALSGAVRDVLGEQVPTYYESATAWTQGAVNWRYLWASHEVIWFSQRDDWGHLYLYDADSGVLKNQITRGRWNVVDLLKVDEKRRALELLGVGREPGRNPYFAHLYRTRFDGEDLTLLTPEDANHEVSLAPSGEYFVDRYSKPDVPAVTVLRNRNGRLIKTLARTDISKLTAIGWRPPVPIVVKGRDRVTDLYGLMYRPTNFDPSHRYPIINRIYPGPQIGSVGSPSFSVSRDAQSLAELGFIVVEIDGTGTSLRSKSFQDVSYGEMSDNTLPDQIAAMKELAQRYSWIDLARAGIHGHSGGGFAAAAAMLRYPDFFKVGVAESGDHDMRGYEGDWGEQYLGLLVRRSGGSSNYDGQDNESVAQNLKGHLLLMHGTLDDNVPPTLTLQLVDALINANRDFDLLLLPNQRHYYSGKAGSYATRRCWDYFVRYLLGAEPPPEYDLHPMSDVAN